MITYQDLTNAAALERFIENAIDTYRSSPEYSAMVDAGKYYDGENPAIMQMVSNLRLENNVDVDLFARIRVPTGLFGRIITQLVNRLWFNAVQLDNISKKERLGKNFDKIAKDIATNAAVHGVCYGFWNLDAIQMIPALNYLPLPDEETGAHKAGISFWQLDKEKPWQIRLFEMDGYTKFSRPENGAVIKTEEKRAYKLNVNRDALGEKIVSGENYPGFPVLPMYANTKHRSELSAPVKAKIDLYDAILTSFGDDVMRTRLLYWIFQGYSGDVEMLAKLRETVESLGIIAPLDDTTVSTVMTDIPTDGVSALLDRLESEIYRDAGVMNAKEITGGSLTNVAIQTAQIGEAMKVSDMEWNGADWIDRLIGLIGFENKKIVFKHETITNDMEITQRLAQYTEVPIKYKLTLDPLFPPEMVDDIVQSIDAEALALNESELDEAARAGDE